MTQDAGERAVPTLPRLEPVHQLSGLAWAYTVNVRLLNGPWLAASWRGCKQCEVLFVVLLRFWLWAAVLKSEIWY